MQRISFKQYIPYYGVWFFLAFIIISLSDNYRSRAANRDANPISTGKIAFVSSRYDTGNFNTEIFLVNPDGTNETRLTNNSAFDTAPKFNPDGSKIVFVSDRDGSQNIYVMKADGTGQTRLTNYSNPTLRNRFPSFSPDGNKIVFSSDRTGKFQLYIMDVDGSNLKLLSHIENASNPVFSPDRKCLAFGALVSIGQHYGAESYVYVMNVDGTNLKRLHAGSKPAFSPDGNEIAFVYSPNVSSNQIYVMKPDGTSIHRLSATWASDANPAFSPDGTKIVFESNSSLRTGRGIYPDVRHGTQDSDDLYIMNADGTNVTRLTNSLGGNGSPAWGVSISGTSSRTPTASMPFLRLSPPTTDTAPDDPIVEFTPKAFRGRLAYAFNRLNAPPFPSYIVLRNTYEEVTTSNEKVKHEAGTGVLNYRIVALDNLSLDLAFDPQFSPDGSRILVKIGEPDPHYGSPYRLYIWDMQANELEQVSSRKLFFRQVWWSPDGNYLAYIAGGDAEGNIHNDDNEPLRLLICDWRTGQEKLVVRSSTVRFNVAWAAPHTLFYSILPQASQLRTPQSHSGNGKEEKTEFNPVNHAIARPNTYEFSIQKNESKLLIQDSQRPTVSPDGQWITFFGSPNPNSPLPLNPDWWSRPGGASLSIIKLDGTMRKAFTRPSGFYPAVIWEPDNYHFLTVEFSQIQSSSNTTIQIKEWNISTQEVRIVSTLHTNYLLGINHPTIEPPARPLKLSKNGNFLFFVIQEDIVSSDSKLNQFHYLKVVELHTGVTSTIARAKDDSGLDWYDEFSPPGKALVNQKSIPTG